MIKTVSLETAKLLKENGFKQDTYFLYGTRPFANNIVLLHFQDELEKPNIWAAPTTDELLEELPKDYAVYNYLESNDMNGIDLIWLFRNPDELAKCWLWLKKECLNG